MTDSISNGGCCSGSVRPGTYGNAYDVAQITVDKCGRITRVTNVPISGGGGGSSQWTGTTGSPIYYVPNVGIGSSTTPTAKLQVTGNVRVSNAVTTQNVFVNDTLKVLGSMTANAANATFFFDTFTIPYINTQYLNVSSNTTLTGNISMYGDAYVSGSLSAARYYGDGGLLSNISSSGFTQPLPNLVVSNSVTTSNIYVANTFQVANTFFANTTTIDMNFNTLAIPYINTSNIVVSNLIASTGNINMYGNVHVSDTLDVLGSMTANAANATFFFDTFTIPYVNTQYLNVSSDTTLTGNLVVATANIATLNVGYLTVNSAVVYGASTLNVYGTSNLSTAVIVGKQGVTTLNMTGNAYVSNAVTTTNVFAAMANISTMNTQVLSVTTNMTFTGPLATLSNLTVPGNANIEYLSVSNLSVTGNLIVTATNVQTTNALTINNSGTATALKVTQNEPSIHTHNVAEFWDATTLAMVIDPEGNVGIHTTSSPGYALTVTDPVNFETLYIRGKSDQTTLNVTGNVYVSNALTTTNVFATRYYGDAGFMSNISSSSIVQPFANLVVSNALTTTNVFVSKGLGVGPGTLGSNVVLFSNVSGGSNTFVMDSNARVSIGAGAFGGGSLLSFGRPFANKVLTLYDVGAGDNPVTATNFYGFGIGTNLLRYQVASAASHGFYGASSEYARITSTGVSILAGANPTSNLQVTGNAYISNTLTTTNVFANYAGIQGISGSNVFLFSNISGGSNVFGMDSNATVVIGISPSSNVNYGNGYTRTAKAGLIINSGGNATYPINLSLIGTTSNTSSYNNGIDFGGGGQGCAQIVHSSIGGGNGALAFYFNNSNGADGNILEYMRMSKLGFSILTGTTARATLDVAGNIYASNAVTTTNVFTSNIVYSLDVLAQGPYLNPSTANASVITQWYSRLVNTTSRPFWSVSATPQFSYINTSNLGGYYSQTLLNDGRVLFNQINGTNIGFFYPQTNQFSYVSGVSINSFDYSGVLQIPDGRVVFVPCNGNKVGLLNPFNYTFSTVSTGTALNNMHYGAVYEPTGNVIMTPTNSSNVGIFNTNTGTYSRVAFSSEVAINNLIYFGSVILPDGRVVFIPNGTSNVGIYTPSTATYSNVTVTVSGKYAGGCLMPDGNVFMVPNTSSSNACIYNPNLNIVSNVTTNGPGIGGNGGSGAVALPDGRIIVIPALNNSSGVNFGIYNYKTGTYSTLSTGLNMYQNSVLLGGGTLLPDGRIIITSQYGAGLLNFRTPAPLEFCLHPFFNKF
jgi:hypothetical protein